jgi:phage anti-repressor protein
MVRLNPHHLSDALLYLFLNLTKRWLHWFPERFAAIRANCAASLVACSTLGITTCFYCQWFSPLQLQATE